ncbi:MAG: hypothetical protein FWG22_06885, partial [Prolixibacteraceae bacterium]|nr:hypothetical protein [Prolixibacteraceae bacterium]
IAFLSPQIARMSGHFSLSWIFWIPIMIWLIIRFDKTRWIFFTILICIVTYIAGFMHFYLMGFMGVLLGGYWLSRFVRYRRAFTFWYRDLIHIFFQFVLPVLAVQFVLLINNNVADRPSHPFGLWNNTTHPVAIFLPSGKPWAFVPHIITVFRHISWESWAYVGTTASIGFFVGAILIVRRFILRKNYLKVNDSLIISILFWVSILALLFSIGLPYILGMNGIATYVGIFRQLRALARFSWVFFYMINIVVFAALFRKAFAAPARWWWKIIAALAVVLLMYEGIFNVQNTSSQLANHIPALEDGDNLTSENAWVHKINPADYQAIIPIPYFHVGSENIWLEGSHNVQQTTMLASLKTGLPTTAVMLNRTSVSQTYVNYALFTEPAERLDFPDYLPDDKPFLVLAMNDYKPNDTEEFLLKQTVFVLTTNNFTLYRLPVSAIRRLNLIYRDKMLRQFARESLSPNREWSVSNASAWYKYVSFDDLLSDNAFAGRGAAQFTSGGWQTVWSDTLKNVAADKSLKISFWINNYKKDAYLQSSFRLEQINQATGEIDYVFDNQFFKYIKAFYGEWALIEFDAVTRNNDEILRLSMENDILKKNLFQLDELLLRESSLNVYQTSGNFLKINTLPIFMGR